MCVRQLEPLPRKGKLTAFSTTSTLRDDAGSRPLYRSKYGDECVPEAFAGQLADELIEISLEI